MTALSSERGEQAARRIEQWLLRSPIQMPAGAQAGGIAGWLDAEGRPAFVYMEITGYYLTWTAWLLAGGGRLAEGSALAQQRGQRALDWLERVLDEQGLPLTRLHLTDGDVPDWRNSAVFTFDLAMAIRGAEAFSRATGHADPSRSPAVRALALRLDEIRDGHRLLQSHRMLHDGQVPTRWSTTPGPHHLKAAASLLAVQVGNGLRDAAKNTSEHWAEELEAGWGVAELHPLLYGLEGMIMDDQDRLDNAAAIFERLMKTQDSSGSLPSHLSGEAIERSDVLAQALRMGAVLRGHGRLQGATWAHRLNLLADRLLAYVHPDGGVGFTRGQTLRNAWCAMFAHQALVSHQATDPSTAALARRYLI